MPLQAREPVTGPAPIRIIRPTVFRQRTVEVGEVFTDTTGVEAAMLCGCGKAVRIAVRETASVEPRTETATVAHQSVTKTVEAPPRRSRRKK